MNFERNRLYTRTKIFHFRDKLDSLAPDVPEIRPPVHVRLKPTNRCNHNCRYCAYRSDTLQLGKDMSRRDEIAWEKMDEILDDLIEMEVRAVTFSGGGEPFCYPHLLDAARKLADSPVHFAALTNGSRLTGDLAECFAHHAKWLRISIDGWEDISYSLYRRVPEGEFTRVMKNMVAFKNRGGSCVLGVSFIVDETNADHVYEFIQKVRNTGADSIKISPCIVDNNGRKNNLYHKPFFQRVKRQLEKAAALAGPAFEIYDAYHQLDEKFGKDYTWCPYLQILPVIGADLNIYACQDKAYNLKEGRIGSIQNQRFRDFWFADKSQFYTIDPSKYCRHHCVSNEKNKMVLDYLQADPNHLAFV